MVVQVFILLNLRSHLVALYTFAIEERRFPFLGNLRIMNRAPCSVTPRLHMSLTALRRNRSTVLPITINWDRPNPTARSIWTPISFRTYTSTIMCRTQANSGRSHCCVPLKSSSCQFREEESTRYQHTPNHELCQG